MPFTLLCSLLLLPLAQTQAPAPAAKPAPMVRELSAHPDWPKAAPADVASPRAVTAAFFQAISAGKGGTLDRERLRSLFVPNGRIEIPLPGSGAKPTDVIFLTPEQYAGMSDNMTSTAGFFDRLIATHLQQFGVMAHVYAAYESRNDPTDAKPFVRGMKSFELLNSGGHWYITQVSWDREREGLAIPDLYLHDSTR